MLGGENGVKHVMESFGYRMSILFFLVVLMITFPSWIFLWMSNEPGVLLASFTAVEGGRRMANRPNLQPSCTNDPILVPLAVFSSFVACIDITGHNLGCCVSHGCMHRESPVNAVFAFGIMAQSAPLPIFAPPLFPSETDDLPLADLKFSLNC